MVDNLNTILPRHLKHGPGIAIEAHQLLKNGRPHQLATPVVVSNDELVPLDVDLQEGMGRCHLIGIQLFVHLAGELPMSREANNGTGIQVDDHRKTSI
ncbi:hypothetical protein AXH35_02465 [Acidipropionibacterium acidipropionici]|uniref:Uncharacterized protein n=1 Tax=Acidipropionibacterium acidipropionici TaxID=1748 RepID=A0AAC9FBT2_9ACTN|nr:hypothetical protein AXH35_02465 [Acidipropionibacterium acidipropionici]AOZ46004.1 hypothetical protein A8L58_03930 [Acidipropionibacterium acidipropionici]